MSIELKDLNDIEKQSERASEGQDTITPLTNTAFLRQLSKLKHHVGVGAQQSSGSTKSINSIGSNCRSETTSFPFDQDTQSVSSLNRLPSNNRVPENLLALFSKDDPSTFSNSDFVRSVSVSAKHLNSLETRTSNIVAEKLVDALSSMVSFNQDFANAMGVKSTKKSNNNNSDELLLDDEFLKNVRLIVQHNELMKKQKLNKSIFACRIFISIFLIIMILMIGYFLKTVYSISESFNQIENFKHFGYARSLNLTRL